jgi:hypothetical protein
MKTASTNKKVREIITSIKESKIIPRPEFQRRLIWTREDKNNFIDTIIRGYPFPEIYLADGDIDLDTGAGTQLLVDGLQRVNTIYQYFIGDPDLKLTTVLSYNDLDPDTKGHFLQYDIAIRDLGSISKDEIVEVFRRLNATKYSLNDIEISNAVYAGELKKFAEEFSKRDFFENNKVFNASDYKRMGDLKYCLSIISTMLLGYHNRDDAFEELLKKYNDDFILKTDLLERIDKVIDFINECGFTSQSRLWKKADLFTAFIEIDTALNIKNEKLQPGIVVESIQTFFDGIGNQVVDTSLAHATYYKSALQASNDKSNRVKRGLIIGELLLGKSTKDIDALLIVEGIEPLG